MDDLILKNGKTVKELKNLPPSKVIRYVRFIQDDTVRSHMYNWLYVNHYSKIQLYGNLNTRINKITSNICLQFIVNNCFYGYEFKKSETTILMDKGEFVNILNTNKIQPILNGVFYKAVTQRILYEKMKNIDNVQKYIKVPEVPEIYEIPEIYENMWQFIRRDGDYIDAWDMFSEASSNSAIICEIPHGNMFIELGRKNEWMKVKYRTTIGFIKCSLTVDDVVSHRVDNHFHKIENKNYHICNYGCNYTIENTNIYGHYVCHVNICRNLCNEITNNFQNKTNNILLEILIDSLTEIERVNRCPKEEKLNSIIKFIQSKNMETTLKYISEMIDSYFTTNTNVTTNYNLGDDVIGGYCDIIINDELINIKCTKSNYNRELLQLLGCVSLANKKKITINKITTINLLEGYIRSFDIESIPVNNFKNYYNILTNNF